MNAKIHKYILFLLLLCSITSCSISKYATLPKISARPTVKEFSRLSNSETDSLNSIYGTNKIFIKEYIQPALIALSYFPDLKDTYIEFKYSKEATTMAARPHSSSYFKKKNKKYIVLINNKENFDGIRLEDVPFNAQIGLFGHELVHIIDYKNHTLWGILDFAFRYLNKKKKAFFEKSIDLATIERGLGWQLYDWADFSMYKNTTATKEYMQFKQKIYLKPNEIIEIMYSLPRYDGLYLEDVKR